MNKEEQIGMLTLLLAYLTSWKEKDFDVHRAWKGYDFDVLDELEEKGYISQTPVAKSLYFTEKGLEKARDLEKQLAAYLS